MKTVYIIDVKSGNLQLLANAIRHIGGYQIRFITNAAEFAQCDAQIERLLFPGVGNFAHFVRQLHERELAAPLRAYIASGRALMGICVGLQALMRQSEECLSGVRGLEILELDLAKFDTADALFRAQGVIKSVPHIGWNSVAELTGRAVAATAADGAEGAEASCTLYGINTTNKYYFVHLYAAILRGAGELERYAADGWDFALADYGSERFVAAAARGNVFATQFHPEKSGVAGLKVLKSFLEGRKYGKVARGDLQTQRAGVERTLGGLLRRVIACLDVRLNEVGDLVVTKGDQYDVREAAAGPDVAAEAAAAASGGIDSLGKPTAAGDAAGAAASAAAGAGTIRNLGKPVDLATRYYQQGADEVTFLNITSFRNSPLEDLPMLQVLSKAAETIFVPLTVGGGIRDMTDPATGRVVPAVEVAHLYFRLGADKVSIGLDAVRIAESYYARGGRGDGTLSIETILATFGVQAVVILVDPRRRYVSDPSETTMQCIRISDAARYGPAGQQYCYYQVTLQGGRQTHELGALELCVACERLGAGEILLNLIDHDGAGQGFNLELLRQVKLQVLIPVIASSGAGTPAHFAEVFGMDVGIDAALGAGLFHRNEYSVNDVKRYLQQEAKMDVRLEEAVEL